MYVYKYRCNEDPSVFQNIFLSLGTVTDNCVAISFILLPLTKRISQWYQFHSDVEDNSSCNDDYQLDYQVILHMAIYLPYVPQQCIKLYSTMIRVGIVQIHKSIITSHRSFLINLSIFFMACIFVFLTPNKSYKCTSLLEHTVDLNAFACTTSRFCNPALIFADFV